MTTTGIFAVLAVTLVIVNGAAMMGDSMDPTPQPEQPASQDCVKGLESACMMSNATDTDNCVYYRNEFIETPAANGGKECDELGMQRYCDDTCMTMPPGHATTAQTTGGDSMDPPSQPQQPASQDCVKGLESACMMSNATDIKNGVYYRNEFIQTPSANAGKECDKLGMQRYCDNTCMTMPPCNATTAQTMGGGNTGSMGDGDMGGGDSAGQLDIYERIGVTRDSMDPQPQPEQPASQDCVKGLESACMMSNATDTNNGEYYRNEFIQTPAANGGKECDELGMQRYCDDTCMTMPPCHATTDTESMGHGRW